jgi:hypothetical protein
LKVGKISEEIDSRKEDSYPILSKKGVTIILPSLAENLGMQQ